MSSRTSDPTLVPTRTEPEPEKGSAARVPILIGLLFGLAGLGSSSAAIALPVMATDLDVSTGVSAWAISLYALMLAVATAVYGRISDLVGQRLPLLVGVCLMTGGALAGALAPDFGVLLGARMIQGAGAAAVPTLGVAIVTARFTGASRGVGPRPRRRPRRGRQLPRPAGRWRRRGRCSAGAPCSRYRCSERCSCRCCGARCPRGGSGARLDLLGAGLVAATAGRGRAARPVPVDRSGRRRSSAPCSRSSVSPPWRCGSATARTASCRSASSATPWSCAAPWLPERCPPPGSRC